MASRSGRHLRSVNRQLLAVPRYHLSTCGHCAFSVAGPTVWNSFPDFIWDPTISSSLQAHVGLVIDDYAALNK